MECVGNSDTNQKQESPKNTKKPIPEPKVGDPGNTMEVEKKERESILEQSDSEMKNILGAVGKILYHRKRRLARKKKLLAAKRRRKYNIRYRASDFKIAQKTVHDMIHHSNKRNCKRLSIYPIINFVRLLRKTIPKEFPLDTIVMTANHIWKRMCREEKLSFIMRAKRAVHNGYID